MNQSANAQPLDWFRHVFPTGNYREGKQTVCEFARESMIDSEGGKETSSWFDFNVDAEARESFFANLPSVDGGLQCL